MRLKKPLDEKGGAIRTQVVIIIVIAIAIIVAIILSNQAYSDTKERATDQFNQQQLELARSTATGIENFIINIEDDLLGLSELPGVQSMEPCIQTELKAIYFGFPSETSLRRLDKNGSLRFIYPNESWRIELVGRDYGGEAYFQKAKDTGDVVVSGLIANEIGEMRIRVARPVYIEDENESRDFNGVIVASFNPKVLSEMYLSPVVSGQTGYAWLLNEEGVFLAHYEGEFVGQDAFTVRTEKKPQLSYEEINEIQRRMMAGEEGLDRYVSGWHRGRVERLEKFIAYAPVHVGDHIWSVAVCAPVEEVELIIAAAYPRELLILGYIILLLIGGGSLFIISERGKKNILEQEVKRRTKELRESEAEYRSLVESTEDSVYLVDKDCRYLFINDKHLSQFGLAADQVIGKTYGELHLPEEEEEFAEKVNQVFETGMSTQHEHRSRRDNRSILQTLSPVKEPDGSVIAVTVVSKDISALKRTEKELIETKDYLSNIIEGSADTITVVDMNGIVRDWNRSAEGIMGYRADEVIGKSNSKFFADPEEADRIMELVRKEREIKNYRVITLRKDGQHVHVSMSAALLKNDDGMPIGTVRVSRDITKIVELEERIREERDNLNLIFESMVDGIYIVSKDYEIEFMNRVLIDEVGDQVGDICYKAFHNREEPCPKCKSSEVMTGKTVRWEWYSHRMNKTYDLIETPLMNVDGTISKLTIFRDITERKRVEQERERLMKEIKSKNSELERFAYTVSHDLRSPLVTIQGFADLLRTDLEQNEKERVETNLNYIKKAATKMDQLLTETLRLSRIGRVVNPPEDVPFDVLVQEAMEQTSEQIRSSGVEVTVAEDFPVVHVDRMRIVEVLVNLITNSIKYMGKQSQPKIDIGYRVDGDATIFFVHDNGIGIDPSQYEKVFALFYKVDGHSKGTGAGLAIVKRIIEVHGGRIWIESEKGKGSTVCFTLSATPGTYG